jgi:hypothetical protein
MIDWDVIEALGEGEAVEADSYRDYLIEAYLTEEYAAAVLLAEEEAEEGLEGSP